MHTVAAAASTWTNIGTKPSSCAGDLDTVCTGRLACQESLAVATFKTLQAGLSCTGWGGLCFRVGFFVGILGVGWSFRGTKAAIGSGG